MAKTPRKGKNTRRGKHAVVARTYMTTALVDIANGSVSIRLTEIWHTKGDDTRPAAPSGGRWVRLGSKTKTMRRRWGKKDGLCKQPCFYKHWFQQNKLSEVIKNRHLKWAQSFNVLYKYLDCVCSLMKRTYNY